MPGLVPVGGALVSASAELGSRRRLARENLVHALVDVELMKFPAAFLHATIAALHLSYLAPVAAVDSILRRVR